MPAGMNTDAFAKYLRKRAVNMFFPDSGPYLSDLLREAAHRLELIERTLRNELPIIEAGLERGHYISPLESEAWLAATEAISRILDVGCGGHPDGQLTLAAGQVPQPGPAAAPNQP